jgi:hypothetical protein
LFFADFFPLLEMPIWPNFMFLFFILGTMKAPSSKPPKGPQRHRQSREKPPCLAKEKMHQKRHTLPRAFSNLVGKNKITLLGWNNIIERPTRF